MASPTGYTSEQLKKFEERLENCKFPNKEQREKWSEGLGIGPDEIKCWFKNRGLLLQKIEEKSKENDALRMENAILRWENLMMSRKLEDNPAKCNMCSRSEALTDLLRENARLREEHQRVTNTVFRILQMQTPRLAPASSSSSIHGNDD